MMKLCGDIPDKGYSLVEVLIVIVILGLVTTGLTVTFITGQQEYSERDATIRMQQQARLAMAAMERDIRMAGNGLKDIGNLRINVYNKDTKETWSVVQPQDTGGGGADIITILYQYPASPIDDEKGENKPSQVTLTSSYQSSKPNLLLVSSSTLTTDYNEFDLFLIYNTEDTTRPASLLQVANIPAPGDRINHASNTSKYPYNPPNGVELFPTTSDKFPSTSGYSKRGSALINIGVYDQINKVARNDIRRVTYRLDGDKLVREEWSSKRASQLPPTDETLTHTVATGIEDLQFRYQFNDGWLDTLGGSGHDVKDVTGVRISIIARTANPDPRHQTAQAFQLTGPLGNGKAYSGGGYRRMTMSTMVSLRNLAMRNAP